MNIIHSVGVAVPLNPEHENYRSKYGKRCDHCILVNDASSNESGHIQGQPASETTEETAKDASLSMFVCSCGFHAFSYLLYVNVVYFDNE